MTKFRVRFGEGLEMPVELRPDLTPTVKSLLGSLPFKSKVQTWGDEVYFVAPFHAPREKDSRMEMTVGEVAYWPDGDAIAVFFGPTPTSEGEFPMAYSPCNILGKVVGDAALLKQVKPGSSVEVSAVKQ